ncbi:probable L-type lectin-domain containing receptor kinase S.5 [Aristolochia californica]|uniref:probable L-type lectin-domain containing receptor kinase S.5 n=1 Tax=Aristolochia californica TaxID=171875 RepID=UPI0035DEBAA8
MSPSNKLAFLFLVLSSFLLQSFSLHFNYTTFNREESLDFEFGNNDSNIYKGALQITRDTSNPNLGLENSSGRILYKDKFKLWDGNGSAVASFETTFVLNIVPENGIGEGLAFILTKDMAVPHDSHGQWLGVVNQATNGSSQNHILAVEFDTRKSFDQDLDSNHVGVNVNSINSIETVSLTRYGVNLSSGEDVIATIRYDGEAKSMFVNVSMHNQTARDNQNSSLISLPIDLSRFLLEDVYVGFSGSTSDQTQLNCVKSWSFSGNEVGEKTDDLRLWWILIGILVPLMIICAGSLWYYFCCRRIKKAKLQQKGSIINSTILLDSTKGARKFRFKELKSATSNFDPRNKLGKGGFGTVYKGTLKDTSEQVAVKRISKDSRQGEKEFVTEVLTFGKLSHKNLVRLIGWCHEKEELLLVYELMPNGSLDKLLFSSGSDEVRKLNWERRHKIISGVAHALCYLHNGCLRRVFHRDVKSSNVMLDSDYEARLGDFGLARTVQHDGKTHHTTSAVAGTPGYIAPEYFLTGRASEETDVYGFGVFALEVACGRRPGRIPPSSNDNGSEIVDWVWRLYGEERIFDAVDPRLGGEFHEDQMKNVFHLGLACCHPNPNERPSMRVAVQVLNGEAPPLAPPPVKPAFMWPVIDLSVLEWTSIDLSDR